MKQKYINVHMKQYTILLVCGLFFLVDPLRASDDVPAGPPAAEDLHAGDLIWPKEPGAIVPYAAPGQETETGQALWKQERDRYIDMLVSRSILTEVEKRRIETLREMSYETFLNLYTEDVPLDVVTPYGGAVGVGHVAIVRKISDKPPTIVEAMWGKGVQEISYEDWKLGRKGQIFWHGRLINVAPEQRFNVANEASREVGKPYGFWNFNLSDNSSFYCSKLAWLAILRATNIAVDDNENPSRLLWLSPKQLLKSHHLEILQNPGDYGSSNNAD